MLHGGGGGGGGVTLRSTSIPLAIQVITVE